MANMRPRLVEYAEAGYLAAAIDCRYHGRRSGPASGGSGRAPMPSYQAALANAWLSGGHERPFLLDNVWDLLHLLDYLQQRPDVDPTRIGMTGVSLGGMHTWLTAAADERVAAAAPVIGVQSFGWALEHNQFQGRVSSIPEVFSTAAAALGRPQVDAGVVQAVWDRLLPGLLRHYDSPRSLPCIAPRPLLIVNGELDPRCPLPGVERAYAQAAAAYAALGAAHNAQLVVEEGVGHAETPAMAQAVRRWLGAQLLHES